MPSSVKPDELQKARIESVINAAFTDAGEGGIEADSGGKYIHELVDKLSPQFRRRHFFRTGEAFDCVKRVLWEMENDDRLVVKEAPQGMKRGKTLVLASLAKKAQASSASGSNHRPHPEAVRATHHITSGVPAAA